ncbi:excitatory amino acid transporter 3-like [Contarinia nasturtii]|uniref:excitatory amino acid transporter 3-like n=1 Tax=Contarinia nasturtii TaxID=265458 RepID=UPI0012D3B904|nr:excitatory amino acid transporter 3-like [Contarinia nasturtii]
MTLKTVTYFATTSLISASIAILIALLFQPGEIMQSTQEVNAPRMKFIDSILDLGRNFFPDNLFQSFFQQVHTVYTTTNSTNGITVARDLAYRAGPSTLGLVTFCILFGSVLNTIGNKGKVIKDFFEGVFEILMKLTTYIMWLNGVGMCSIITGKLLSIGNLQEILSQLAVFVCCVLVGLAFHQLVMLPTIYFIPKEQLLAQITHYQAQVYGRIWGSIHV